MKHHFHTVHGPEATYRLQNSSLPKKLTPDHQDKRGCVFGACQRGGLAVKAEPSSITVFSFAITAWQQQDGETGLDVNRLNNLTCSIKNLTRDLLENPWGPNHLPHSFCEKLAHSITTSRLLLLVDVQKY
jgi:hypothetical protein